MGSLRGNHRRWRGSIDRLRLILWVISYSSDTEPHELKNGLLTFIWGVWLLAPWATFEATPKSWQVMGSILPEWGWGLFIASLGLFQLTALYTARTDPRRNAAFIACLLWAGVAAMIFLANPIGTGGIVYGFIAAWQGWVYIRLGRHYRNPSSHPRGQR